MVLLSVRKSKSPSALHLFLTLLAFLGVLRPIESHAASFILAQVNPSIWAGNAACNSAASGNVLTPVVMAIQNCERDYTTTQGLNSSIVLTGTAVTAFGSIGTSSTGLWTNMQPPDFTNGNWGVTASVSSGSFGESFLEATVTNRSTIAAISLSATATMRLVGTMSFQGTLSSLNPVVLPWTGTETASVAFGFPSLTDLAGGCDITDSTQSPPTPVSPGVYQFDRTCVGVMPSIMLPQMTSATFRLKITSADTAATNGNVLAYGGGTFGLNVDFSHTTSLTALQFLVNGVPVDPSTLDITTDAPVRFTSSGIVPLDTATPVPEPGSVLLLGSGVAVVFRRLRRRHGPDATGRDRSSAAI
jgi:hypothetical protein